MVAQRGEVSDQALAQVKADGYDHTVESTVPLCKGNRIDTANLIYTAFHIREYSQESTDGGGRLELAGTGSPSASSMSGTMRPANGTDPAATNFWEFDGPGIMRRRWASINDAEIKDDERRV